MNATTTPTSFEDIKRELENSEAVCHCATKYGNTGDPTSMKTCYLLRHYPELTVSQIAELVGVSVSAASRCLKRLNRSEVVSSRKEGQSVFYRLQDNEFTRTLLSELAK